MVDFSKQSKYNGNYMGGRKNLDTSRIMTYWANSSFNSMVGKLIREGSTGLLSSEKGF